MIIHQLENNKSLTYQEKNIAEYIMKHPSCIVDYNAKELAKVIFTSSSSIIRLTQKLGYKGYPDFKNQYMKEYITNNHYNKKISTTGMLASESIDVVDNLHNLIIKETKQILSIESLVRVINYMRKFKRMDFYASDINYYHIQSMCHRLNTLNIQAQAFNTLNQDYLQSIPSNEVLSFVTSHSGNNPTMLDIAYALRKRNIQTIAITGKHSMELELICNESLHIYSSNKKLRSLEYGLSLEYLLNVLYVNLIVEHS